MCDIETKLKTVLARIRKSEIDFQRKPGSVRLLAVSKTKPLADIKMAINHGQMEFGENYLQEAIEKIQQVKKQNVKWHFIGHVQSNKAKMVSENFSWVHTLDKIKTAKRLDKFRPHELGTLNVCIQINTSKEISKSGCDVKIAFELAQEILNCKNLKLRGLMAIPAPASDFAEQRRAFAEVKNISDDFNRQGFKLDILSMGMSADLEAAIAEGANIVRIGTDIFGVRT